MNELVRGKEPTTQLVKVTFAYSLEEDRVRMDALDSDGGTVRLWFTARLLERFVPYMVQKQKDALPLLMTHDPSPIDITGPPLEQQSVVCHPNSADVLITAIDIHSQPQQIVLIFKDMDCSNRLALVLAVSAIDQWNAGLKQCFEQAGWSSQSFKDDLQNCASLKDAITIH